MRLAFCGWAAPARADQGAQAGVQVEVPGIRADVEALVLGDQPDVGEADLGLAVPRGDLEADLGVFPLGLAAGEVEVVVQDAPGDSFGGDQLGDLDPAAMGVLIPVGELAAGLVGATLDVLGPPATDVVDGLEDFFGCLVHGEGGGEARVSGWSGGHVGAPGGLGSWACHHGPVPGSRRHRWRATALVPSGYVLSRGCWPREYVAASDGGLDSGVLGEPGQLRAAVTGLHQKPF